MSAKDIEINFYNKTLLNPIEYTLLVDPNIFSGSTVCE